MMKKYFYSILSLLLLAVCTASAAVGDVVTLANLSQDKSYKITCARGDLTLNSALTFPCSSTNDGKSTVDGADKWVVRNIGANYYLYNIAAKKFLASDNSLTTGPLALSIVASDQEGKYTIKGTDANANWLNNNNSGAFDIRNYKSNDPGNRIWFVEAGDFDGNFNGVTFGNALTTITFSAQKGGKTVATEVFSNCVDGFTYTSTLPEIYPGAVLATPSATATATNQTINTTYTVDPAACPIKYSTSYDNATWYKIKIQRSTAKYSSFDGTNITNTSGSEPTTALENMFAFVGDPFGFNLYNAKAGKNAPFGPASSAGGPNLSAATASTAATLVYEVSTENSNFKLLRNVDNEIGYLNDVNNKLGFWLSSNNRHDDGSNFAFIEVPEDLAEELVGKSIDITYNIYLGDNLIATKVVKENKNEAPTFDLSQYSSYVDISDMPTTITSAQTTYNIHSSYKSTFPISTGKWYNLAENRSPALQIYTTEGVTDRIETQAVAKTAETWDNYMWRFEGDWYNGFRLYNKAAEKYVSYSNTTTSPGSNTKAYLTNNDEVGSYFEYAFIKDHNFLKIKGSTNVRISNWNGSGTTYLTNWNAIDNNDAGSQILITECEELQDDDITLFTEALNAALAKVNNLAKIPALYSSDAITTATNALNAIECTKASQIDAAILKIAPIINTLYASANGKMIAVKNVNDGQHRYLAATPQYMKAGNKSLTVDAVLKIEYVEGENKYYFKGVYNDVYASGPQSWNSAVKTSSSPTAFFIGVCDDAENNEIYITTNFERDSNGRAIHFSPSYGENNTCGWDYRARASWWTVEDISDVIYAQLAVDATYALREVVGYPKNMSSLERYLENGVTEDNKDAALTAITELYEVTDINLPVDGKAYEIIAKGSSSCDKLYYDADADRIVGAPNPSDNYIYVCKKVGENKFVFTNKQGKLLVWGASIGVGGIHRKAYIDMYSNYADIVISKALENTNGTGSKATAAQRFGCVTMQGVRTNTSNLWYSNYNHLDNPIDEEANTFVEWTQASTWYDSNGPRTHMYMFKEVADVTANTEGYADGVEKFTLYKKAENSATTYADNFGEGLGEYSYTDKDGVVKTENELMDDVNACTTLEEERSVVNSFGINKPTPGNFLVIQGTTGNKYMNGRALSDDKTVMWYGEDNKLITYSTGLGFINTSYDATYENNGSANTQTFAESQTPGTYFIISNAIGVGQYMYENTNNVDRYDTKAHDRKRWNVSYATSLPVTITAAGYATLYSPVALEIPTGVKAYGATEATDDVIKFDEITGIIPANTGVIIEGEPNTYNFNITTGGIGSSTLAGTVPTIAKGETAAYTLQKKDNVLGFYKYTGTALNGFKSYLTLGSSSNGFVIALPGDDLTGINDATDATQTGEYIDLLGNKVSNPQKGQIYICNGKLIKY